jgi:hypothetical protein
VNRKSAFRAADLINQVEQIASLPGRYEAEAEGGGVVALRLLQEARVRAQPLNDPGLDDRFNAAVSYTYELLDTWAEDPPGGARHWLREAIANVRAGIVPHLAAPKFVGRERPPERSFPTSDELSAMRSDPRDGHVLLNALVEWRANQGK